MSCPSESELAELALLRTELGGDESSFDGGTLLKFVRWKPGKPHRAAAAYRNLEKWKAEHQDLVADGLSLNDPVLMRIVSSGLLVQPDLVDGHGRAILFARFRLNDRSDGRRPLDVARAILWNLERLLSRPECQHHGAVLIHDLSGIGRQNLMPQVPRVVLPAVAGKKIPLRLAGVFFLNAPFFFPAILGMMKLLRPAKMRLIAV